jgi:hypothetical protein
MNGLAADSYFTEVTHAVQLHDFVRFAQVTIDQNESDPRMNMAIARSTNLFFHYPNKNMILQLEFYEDSFYASSTDRLRCFWNIDIEVELLPNSKLPPHAIPFRDKSADPKGIRFMRCDDDNESPPVFSRMYGQKSISSTSLLSPIEASLLGMEVHELTKNVLPYVSAAPFQRLNVNIFPPGDAFPNCEKLFWKKFNKRYLRSLVRKPFGSPHLEH